MIEYADITNVKKGCVLLKWCKYEGKLRVIYY